MQNVFLSGYDALIEGDDGSYVLCLGTWGSYGSEKLKIVPVTGWEGLTITATFVTPKKSVRVVVPDDGVISVPQEATAKPFIPGFTGKIVFSGVADGVQRISTDLPFIVKNHAPVEGSDPSPSPSEWEQYVNELKSVVEKSVPQDGMPGQVLTKTEDGNAWTYPSGGGGGGGYTIGAGLKLDPESNILSVDTADEVEKDNTKPITSAAVYTTVGNIEALLGTI